VKIGDSIACDMARNTVGWIVRTETAGRHRYWKVGVVDADRAAVIAHQAAGADTAKSVTSIPSHLASAFGMGPGVVTEVVWECRPVPHASEPSEAENHVGAQERMLGEITFDTVVPEEGFANVEGCYRVNGGNWYVYYLTNWRHAALWRHATLRTGLPMIERNAIFQSGISGVSGAVPESWILNKKTIKEILAEAVGVDGWIEVCGPDSLLLK
jgi:hypothetical protein